MSNVALAGIEEQNQNTNANTNAWTQAILDSMQEDLLEELVDFEEVEGHHKPKIEAEATNVVSVEFGRNGNVDNDKPNSKGTTSKKMTTPSTRANTNAEVKAEATALDDNEQDSKKIIDLLEDAVNVMLDDEEDAEIVCKKYKSSIEQKTFRSVLKLYNSKKLVIPNCQRPYIWSSLNIDNLFWTIDHALPIGMFLFAEHNGTIYLLDGLQRFTTLSNKLLSLSSKEEQKELLDIPLTVSTTYNMTLEDMLTYFRMINSAVALASAVKARAELPAEMQDIILKLSKEADVFKLYNVTKTFLKNQHAETIVSNLFPAVLGEKYIENQPKTLVNYINAHLEDIDSQVVGDCWNIINRISEAYLWLKDTSIISRSISSSSLSSLIYVVNEFKELSAENIADMIYCTFKERRFNPEYSKHCGSTAYRATKVEGRIKYWKDLALKVMNDFDIDGFKDFNKTKLGKFVNGFDSNIKREWNDIPDAQRKALYTAYAKENHSEWDKILLSVPVSE